MPSDDIQEQLNKAKALIKSKQYDDARKLLKTVKHPKATAWLAKLDEVSPAQPRYTARRTALLIIMIPFGLLVLFGAFLVVDQVINGDSKAARSRLFGYCLDIYRDVGEVGVDECVEWYPAEFDMNGDKVTACHKLSPVLDDGFYECLIDEDILPWGFTTR